MQLFTVRTIIIFLIDFVHIDAILYEYCQNIRPVILGSHVQWRSFVSLHRVDVCPCQDLDCKNSDIFFTASISPVEESGNLECLKTLGNSNKATYVASMLHVTIM